MSLLLEYCQDLYILNEAYYGKPKEFIEIEKRLEKIIDMVKLSKEHPEKAINVNDMKELYEIEKIFTKFFGNSETEISFYIPIADTIKTGLQITGITTPQNISTILNLLDIHGYTLCTLPSSLSYFKKSKTNKKLVDPKDLYINVFIDIGIIYALDLTPQELMAMILHEIGHSFDASFFNMLSYIDIDLIDKFNIDNGILTNITFKSSENVFRNILDSLYGFILRTLPIGKFYTMMNKLIINVPILNTIMSSINYILNDIWSLIRDYKSYNKILLMITNPIIIATGLLNPTNTFGYATEKFADSFATSYGYGKDVVSYLNKRRINKGRIITENISKIPILNLGYDLNTVMIEIATILSSPHPNYINRIQSQLNKLKRDMNDPNLPPKVKKELLINIEELEDYINNVVLNIDHESNHGRLISYMKNYIMIKLFKGKLDPRELFEAVWNHEM